MGMLSEHQPDLFNRAAGAAARDAGMKRAADNNASLLEYARGIAYGLAKQNGTVTADDVTEAMTAAGVREDQFGNWLGSLFKDGRFRPTGTYVKARRVKSHSRAIAVWRLK